MQKYFSITVATLAVAAFLSVTVAPAAAGKPPKPSGVIPEWLDKKIQDKKNKDKKQDEIRDQLISLLTDQVARDQAQVALDQQRLSQDSAAMRYDRIPADTAQLHKSLEKLEKDKKLLAQAQSAKGKK